MATPTIGPVGRRTVVPSFRYRRRMLPTTWPSLDLRGFRPRFGTVEPSPRYVPADGHRGTVAPGFEPVRDELECDFACGARSGPPAACTAAPDRWSTCGAVPPPPPARRPTPIAPCNWWRRRPRGRSRSSPTGWPSAARSTWTRPLRATARVHRRGQGGPARAVAAQPPGGPPRRRASKPLARRRAAGPTRIRSCGVGSYGRARRMRIVEPGGDES
jgi:hypothetical protein